MVLVNLTVRFLLNNLIICTNVQELMKFFFRNCIYIYHLFFRGRPFTLDTPALLLCWQHAHNILKV